MLLSFLGVDREAKDENFSIRNLLVLFILWSQISQFIA